MASRDARPVFTARVRQGDKTAPVADAVGSGTVPGMARRNMDPLAGRNSPRFVYKANHRTFAKPYFFNTSMLVRPCRRHDQQVRQRTNDGSDFAPDCAALSRLNAKRWERILPCWRSHLSFDSSAIECGREICAERPVRKPPCRQWRGALRIEMSVSMR